MENSFRYLENIKQKHYKVMHLEHKNLEVQKYMLPIKEGISNEERQLIFKMRSKVTNVKINMKGIYDAHECQAC